MAVTDIQTLKSTVRLCMFDQYGTVVDMQGGLREFAAPFLKDKGWTGDPNAFVTWWRRTHFENSMIDALLGNQHTSYRQIGHLSVRQVMDRAGIAHTEDEVHALVAAIERLPCFPEVPEALTRLRKAYRLVVLSNGDPDMLETAKQYHRIPFDAVISVSEANAFKPHRATYEMAARKMGVAMDEVLFVANHEFDCVGAKAAGMRTVFINRRRRPFARWPHQPDLIVASMTELAELLG
jgi:2-haloacid dehalogenase